jgi:predicted nucleic acid-binding protein
VILVVDAGPLITLARIGTLELLRRSAEQIFIPEAVYRECVTQAQGRPGSVEIAQAAWIVRQTVQNQTTVTRLRSRVGWGEAEAIVLAQQLHADAVVLDDATARHVAEQEGCVVVGLLGLLVDAKRRDLIPTVKPLLNAMRQAHFFITDALYEAILRQAGEDPRR